MTCLISVLVITLLILARAMDESSDCFYVYDSRTSDPQQSTTVIKWDKDAKQNLTGTMTFEFQQKKSCESSGEVQGLKFFGKNSAHLFTLQLYNKIKFTLIQLNKYEKYAIVTLSGQSINLPIQLQISTNINTTTGNGIHQIKCNKGKISFHKDSPYLSEAELLKRLAKALPSTEEIKTTGIEPCVQYKYISACPNTVTMNEITQGENSISCTGYGAPPLTLTWTSSSGNIKESQYKTEEYGHEITSILDTSNSPNNTVYTCVINNTNGKNDSKEFVIKKGIDEIEGTNKEVKTDPTARSSYIVKVVIGIIVVAVIVLCTVFISIRLYYKRKRAQVTEAKTKRSYSHPELQEGEEETSPSQEGDTECASEQSNIGLYNTLVLPQQEVRDKLPEVGGRKEELSSRLDDILYQPIHSHKEDDTLYQTLDCQEEENEKEDGALYQKLHRRKVEEEDDRLYQTIHFQKGEEVEEDRLYQTIHFQKGEEVEEDRYSPTHSGTKEEGKEIDEEEENRYCTLQDYEKDEIIGNYEDCGYGGMKSDAMVTAVTRMADEETAETEEEKEKRIAKLYTKVQIKKNIKPENVSDKISESVVGETIGMYAEIVIKDPGQAR